MNNGICIYWEQLLDESVSEIDYQKFYDYCNLKKCGVSDRDCYLCEDGQYNC